MNNIILLTLKLSLASKIVEYRPSINFGQVFYDFSGNKNHGVNGVDSTSTTSDVFSTDRGAYFGGASVITMPPNDQVPTAIYLSPVYSVVIWVNLFSKNSFLYFDYYQPSDLCLYIHIFDGSNVALWILLPGGASCKHTTYPACNSYVAQWNLFVVVYNGSTASLIINNVVKFTLSLSTHNYSQTVVFAKTLSDATFSIEGFLWYAAILNDTTSYSSYMTSSSSGCLTGAGTCTVPCSPGFVDPYAGTGCVSLSSSTTADAGGLVCPSSTTGCSGTISLVCSCSTNACYVINSIIACLACGLQDYSSGSTCLPCVAPCSGCIDAVTCLSCVAANAAPSAGGGCQCNAGFYGTTPLITAAACSACYLECTTCTQGSLCQSCVASNASPNSSQGCTCNAGYYGVPPLNTTTACLACGPQCATCSSLDLCTSCISLNSSALPTGECICDPGFINTTALTSFNSCISFSNFCDPSCISCTGAFNYQCTNCSNFYLDGYCIATCPLGYTATGQNCTYSAGLVTDFKFAGSGSAFNSTNNQLTGYVITPVHRRLQNPTGPMSVYGRGLYFPGTGYLSINTSQERIFGSAFSIAAWINPSSGSGVLLYKSPSVLSLSLVSLYPVINITINSTVHTYTSPTPVLQSQWNQLLLSINYSVLTAASLSLALNGNQGTLQTLASVPFLDSANTSLVLGYSPFATASYSGFLYELGFYIAAPALSGLVTSTCDSCSLCPSGGVCISSCGANSYYSNSTSQCVQCATSCTSGCVNSQSCGLCVDQYCLACSSFSPNSCTQCNAGYMVQNSLCVACNYSSYYESTSRSCLPCQGLCDSCSSDIVCLTCLPNSAIANDYSCQCMQGYSGDSCSRNSFNASMSIDQNNLITLSFSEPLHSSLLPSSLGASVNGVGISFTMNSTSLSVYTIGLDIVTAITANSKVVIQFVGNIVSVNNALLATNSLSSNLFMGDTAAKAQATKVKAAAAKATAKTGTTAGASVSLGLSLANFNPTSIFDFLNTAEILYSAYLLGVDMPLVLSEFLMGLRNGVLSNFPNAFSYFINSNKGVTLNSKWQAYGYTSNLMILNAGPYMTVLAFALIMLMVCLLVGLKAWCKNKLKSVIKYYRYGFFLRFWIQAFLEILTCCCVGIKYSKLENVTQVVDYCFCVAFIVNYT